MIYTGPIDYYFNYCYGKLPYRSIDFKFETIETENFQPQAPLIIQTNIPIHRITEFKYLQAKNILKHPSCMNIRQHDGDPYYPVPRPENAELYKKYQLLDDSETNDVYFTGRLATTNIIIWTRWWRSHLTLFKKIASQANENCIPMGTKYPSLQT